MQLRDPTYADPMYTVDFLRTVVVNRLCNMATTDLKDSLFETLSARKTTLETLCQKISHETEWADSLEISALCSVYEFNVLIVRANHRPVLIDGNKKKRVFDFVLAYTVDLHYDATIAI